jgi:hypothetical protein
MTVLYLAAAALVYQDVADPDLGATPAEMTGTAVVVLALVMAAFAIPRRTTSPSGWVPAPWLIGCGAVAALTTDQLLPTTWTAVAVDILVLSLLIGPLLFWSRRSSWGRRHVLAVGGAALLVRATLSFWVEPLGNPPYAVKYVVNSVITLGVVVLLTFAYRRLRQAELTTV